MTDDLISVILPTYNPVIPTLNQVISGLQNQTLALPLWELIIIDNNSSPAVAVDLSWHPNYQLVTAKNPGLTHARLKGFENSSGNIIVMVDDDNILDENYLKNTLEIFGSNPKLGAIGGKSIPVFEKMPPAWLKEFYANLALRDMGENILTANWNNEYPDCAPIGAGMCVRKAALKSYTDKINSGGATITDRKANSLSSGGDNDMVIEILRSGWQAGYFPSLALKHIIPEGRMAVSYLARLLNNTNKSWVQVLEKHGINPWGKISKWSKPLRKAKAWFTYQAWKNDVNYIKWRGACGLYDGLSA